VLKGLAAIQQVSLSIVVSQSPIATSSEADAGAQMQKIKNGQISDLST
tara:strand:- start:300 stop:443 length:144 start_codon:yes stop_codon:yes gene_type:complete